MTTEYVLALKVTSDGKLAVTGLKAVEDASKRAGDVSADAMKRTEDAAGKVPPALGNIAASLRTVITVAAAWNVAKQLIQTTDAAVLAEARIRLVTRSLHEQKLVYDELYQIANRVQLPVQEILNSYPRMARAIKEVGGTTREALDVTRAFALSVKVSGATQAEAAASALQFAQALSSGRLQGDELRSVMENNALLAEKLARGLGVTTGELRKMGEEGLLTTNKVKQALLSQLPELEREATRIPRTVAGAWTELANEMKRATGDSDRLRSSQNDLAKAIKGVADAMTARRKAAESAATPNPFSKRGSAGTYEHWDYEAYAREQRRKGRYVTREQYALQLSEDRAKQEAEGAVVANARREFKQAITDAGGLDSTLAKIDANIKKLKQSHQDLVVTGKITAQEQSSFASNMVDLERQKSEAVDNHAKRGQASYAAQVEALDKLLAAQRAGFEQEMALTNDAIKRELDALAFKHSQGIVLEQDFIDRRAVLQAQAAANELAVARRKLADEQALLKKATVTPAIGANEREGKEAKIAQIKKDIVVDTTKEVELGRELNDVERHRVEDQTKLTREVQQRLVAMRRETEDTVRSILEESEQMKLQLELIGQTEKIQQAALIDRKAALAVQKEELKLERDIQDLKRNGASRTEIDARLAETGTRVDAILDGARDQKDLAEKIITSQTQDRIAGRITDAILKGGKNLKGTGKDILKIIQDELINEFVTIPVKLAIKDVIGQITQALGPQAGIIGALSSIGGSLGAKALGAGTRGQQAGGIAGLLFGALPGALIGKFTDPHGDAERQGMFGTNPNGNYSFQGRTAFGTVGTFNDKWFSQADMGERFKAFFASLASIEGKIAGMLKPDEFARVQATINTPKNYGFGMEHQNFDSQLLAIVRDRMSAVIEGVLPGLGHLVKEFQGTGEELMAFTENLLQLRDGVDGVDKLIASVTENAKQLIENQLASLKQNIETARAAFDAASTEKDASKMLAAERQLTDAIVQSYQTRVQMARQLQENINQAEEQGYQFLMGMAAKINALGGKVNAGDIAGNRASQLYGRIGGAGNVAGQIRDLNAYVGAREAEYNARRAAIIGEAEAQLEAQRAMIDAQRSATEARINALQRELQLANQFAALVDRTTGMIDSLRFNPTNPLHALGRLGLADTDLAQLKARYEGATGSDRATAAGRYADALQSRIALAEESHQRPSEEYLRYYNETITELSRVRDEAGTEADRAAALQERIAALQEQANGYQQQTADATTYAKAQLDSLDGQFRAYYEDAQAMGEKLYDEQIRIAKENLDALTGGQEIELAVAQWQKESRDTLVEIKELLRAFLAGGGVTTVTGSGAGTGTGVGTGSGTGVGNTGGGGPRVLDIPISINLGGLSERAVMRVISDNPQAVAELIGKY